MLVSEEQRQQGELPVTYDLLADDVRAGDRILVDDGLLELTVLAVRDRKVTAKVVHGGLLKSHKGMNLPGVQVSAPSITDKDLLDIEFAVTQGLDYLALSFVRRAEDIAELRGLVPKGLLIVAKIEKDSALANIESIVRASDGVMVARGDLGVELPFEEVPYAQKRIIAVANHLGRPVITATQMLESMITHPRPTRAEASDVAANAILGWHRRGDAFGGNGGGRLSAAGGGSHESDCARDRTASGGDAPRGVARVAGQGLERIRHRRGECGRGSDAACSGVDRVHKERLQRLYRRVAEASSDVPILVLTDIERTYRQLSLVWGVIPELVPHCDTYESMVRVALEVVKRRELAAPGDRVVVTAGVPFDVPGSTKTLKVETV